MLIPIIFVYAIPIIIFVGLDYYLEFRYYNGNLTIPEFFILYVSSIFLTFYISYNYRIPYTISIIYWILDIYILNKYWLTLKQLDSDF